MTYSLGHVASRSTAFATALVNELAGHTVGGIDEGVVRLQTVAAEQKGRTDVEVRVGSEFIAILEAKRGPWLPSLPQLEKYVPLLKHSGCTTMRLVGVTNTPQLHAERTLPSAIDGVPVCHLTWRRIRTLAEHARSLENNRNKHLLDEFTVYLGGILGMEVSRSNMVYVVSLGPGEIWGLRFRDVVEQQRRYFFPTEGGGWPEPPNYIAFRYDGRLQSIHHVDGHDLFTNPKQLFPKAQHAEVKPHYCLRLGPPIRPAHEVKAGPNIKRAMRVWCMIDALLTCPTISAAHAETKRRLGSDAPEATDEAGAGGDA